MGSDGRTSEWNYSELWNAVQVTGQKLNPHINTGDRILVSYGDVFYFAAAFLGALLVGAIPVPCPPLRFQAAKRRAESIIQSCAPVANLGEAAQAKSAACILGSMLNFDLSEALQNDGLAQPIELPNFKPETVAFLQYTSGSTSEPRGVMVTHGNLAAMSEALYEFGGQRRACNYFGSLPMSHDMGIIGLLLQPLWMGGSTTIMRPESFLKHPELALQSMGKYKIDFAGGPPFFFEAMLEVPSEQLTGLDLSAWKVAFVGAEMIPARLLRKFSRRFAQYGFSSLTFAPCYGLAECTLLVTGVKPDTRFSSQRLPDGTERCLCGGRLNSGQICIVEPDSLKPKTPGQTGEILIQGPEVGAGYWNAPEATQLSFKAQVEGHEGDWLRTGDLGRMDGKNLIIEGRKKEILIFDGFNQHPQDIEAVITSYLGQPNRVAAIQPHSGIHAHKLVLLIEPLSTKAQPIDLKTLSELARATQSELGVLPQYIGILHRSKLATTTSGKLQRIQIAESFAKAELDIAVDWSVQAGDPIHTATQIELKTEAEIRDYIIDRIAHYLRVHSDQIRPEMSLLDTGLDSSLSMQLILDLEKVLGVRLPDSILINNPTIVTAAKLVYAEVEGPAKIK